MNTILNNLYRLLDNLFKTTSNFDETTWGIIAAATVIFGYFSLRGNLIR